MFYYLCFELLQGKLNFLYSVHLAGWVFLAASKMREKPALLGGA